MFFLDLLLTFKYAPCMFTQNNPGIVALKGRGCQHQIWVSAVKKYECCLLRREVDDFFRGWR